MKNYFMAAGALLLATSALAWAPDMISDDPYVDKPAPTLSKTMTRAAYEPVATAQAKDTDWNPATDKLDLADGWAVKPDPKFQTAAFDPEPKVVTAYAEPVGDNVVADKWVGDRVLADSSSVDVAAPADTYAGLGGPDTTPRAAAGNYPPCSPGPGDDNCIQLYEPGVRTQLASWTGATGGLADGEQAINSPYQPAEFLVSSDPVTNEMDSETFAEAPAMNTGIYAETADPAVGMGGPIESQSNYPPCEPGPGDDRCIQLYERGVTAM